MLLGRHLDGDRVGLTLAVCQRVRERVRRRVREMRQEVCVSVLKTSNGGSGSDSAPSLGFRGKLRNTRQEMYGEVRPDTRNVSTLLGFLASPPTASVSVASPENSH